MAPLRDDLRPFRSPTTYDDDFAHNFAVVAAAPGRPALSALLETTGAALDVEADVLAQSLRRHLLTSAEYRRGLLAARTAAMGRSLAVLMALALRGNAVEPTEVLVDAWYPEAVATFYGPELLEALRRDHNTAVADLSASRAPRLADVARIAALWPGLVRAEGRVRRQEGVTLVPWIQTTALEALTGRSLRGTAVILSGNDNGFPAVLAAAAGARTVLVQNGLRARLSDSAFLQADHYLALGGPAFDAELTAVGSRFGELRHVGSVRLATALREHQDQEAEFDVLYVSSLEPAGSPFETVFGAYYSMDAERAAIAAVTELAQRSGLQVGYYPRYEQELDDLRRDGMVSPAVRYLPRSPGGIYRALLAARVVLSTGSTASVEAAGAGRPVLCLELSGNRGRTAVFARLGLELREDDLDGLEARVRRLATQGAPPTELAAQTPDVAEAVAASVASAAVARNRA